MQLLLVLQRVINQELIAKVINEGRKCYDGAAIICGGRKKSYK
jgi:hypothetical protein